MICPKCSYTRKPEDQAPWWQCPQCGVAYGKVTTGAKEPTTMSSKTKGTPHSSPYSSANPRTKHGFKTFRVTVLLLILAGVALDTWLTKVRATDWDRPLWVVVYPIAAEPGAALADYVPTLSDESFRSVEEFFSDQAARYNVALKSPVDMHLGPVVAQLPPLPPERGHMLQTMWWSLKLRYWAMMEDNYKGPRPDIRIFVLYHALEDNKRLPHSTGLEKGMVSIVHAFADRRLMESNNVVIAHELLHTLGATDKYDLATGMPIYPQGFAEPDLSPRYPQRLAEIMGAYIPISAAHVEQPRSLNNAVVGPDTAAEIKWRDRI